MLTWLRERVHSAFLQARDQRIVNGPNADELEDSVAAQPKKIEATEQEGTRMQHRSRVKGLEGHIELST